MLRAWGFLAIAGWLTVSEFALAKPPAKANAAAMAKTAAKLYGAGKYADAAELLEQAYRIDPHPVYLFNQAKAHDQAGNLQQALDAYRLYLALPSATKELSAKASLAVDRVQALLDKQTSERRGQEELRLKAEQDAASAQRLAAEEAERARRALRDYETTSVHPAPSQTDAQARFQKRKWAAISTGAGAAVAAGVAIGLGVSAHNSRSLFTVALTLPEKQGLQRSSQQAALGADVCWGLALALGISTAIIAPKEAPPISVALVPTRGGVWAGVEGALPW